MEKVKIKIDRWIGYYCNYSKKLGILFIKIYLMKKLMFEDFFMLIYLRWYLNEKI